MRNTVEINVDKLYNILLKARGDAEAVIATSTINRSTDDQDCYQRGIVISKNNLAITTTNLKKLSSVFPWIKFDSRRRTLHILTKSKAEFRLQQLDAFNVIAKHLNEMGIECYADVNWHG
jgi:hypothetical protein